MSGFSNRKKDYSFLNEADIALPHLGTKSKQISSLFSEIFTTKTQSFIVVFCYVFIVRCYEPRTMNNGLNFLRVSSSPSWFNKNRVNQC